MTQVHTVKTFVLVIILPLIIALEGTAFGQSLSSTELFAPVVPPRAHYSIDCLIEIDSDTARFAGIETIVMTNNTTRPLERLALEWSADTLHKLEISANGQPAEIVLPPGYGSSLSPVIIHLPVKVESGQQLEMIIQFERAFPFASDQKDLRKSNWFPRVDWGMPAQDDFTVKLRCPSEYTLVSSGKYNKDTGVYQASGVRRFGIHLAKNVEVDRKFAGEVSIQVVHTPEGAECAGIIMETATDAIDYFVKRFGFYPSDHLVIVPGADEPMGGYPSATNLVVIHGMEKMSERDEYHWRWITAHEIGHQYWFEYVMPQPSQQIGWLMIGLGIYVDREYSRFRNFPQGKHQGFVSTYLSGVRNGVDTRADVHDDYIDNLDFDFNNIVMHGKGYSIISALNCFLGDSLFDHIHSRCLREFAGRRMSDHDFQTVCEQESNQDLDWFFDQWVRSSRILSYRIVSQECLPAEDGYRTEILVERQGSLDMPVPVTAYFADGSKQTKCTSRCQSLSSIHFLSNTILNEAVIDARGELPNLTEPPSEEELSAVRELLDLPDPSDLAAIPELVEKVLEMDIQETYFWGRLGRRLYSWEYYEEALAVFRKRLELLEQVQSQWVASACGWQGLLLDLLGRRDEALESYRKALAIETDRDFEYDGDPVTINREWLEERLITPYQRQ